MTEDDILEIGIDEQGRIYAQPAVQKFLYIYRAAMEVHWDTKLSRLHSPAPREWSYLQWYKQIMAAAVDEYGVNLNLTDKTVWVNIPDELRSQIEATVPCR